MAFRAFITAAAALLSTSAAAATLSPSAAGGTNRAFSSESMASLDPTCGSFRSNVGAELAPPIGYFNTEPVAEGRLNYEYQLRSQDARPGATATLSFEAEQAFGGEFRICVLGYEGDGVITEADFQPTGAMLLTSVALDFQERGTFEVDLTDFVDRFERGDFFGILFALDSFEDNFGNITNVQLSIDSGRVPEPAAVGLLGLGLAGVLAGRRSVLKRRHVRTAK